MNLILELDLWFPLYKIINKQQNKQLQKWTVILNKQYFKNQNVTLVFCLKINQHNFRYLISILVMAITRFGDYARNVSYFVSFITYHIDTNI